VWLPQQTGIRFEFLLAHHHHATLPACLRNVFLHG
jgi:hypothetical protein